MSYEMTVGLLVTDHEMYAQYRAEMRPILDAARGEFRYDFDVARVLKSEAGHQINRVFVLGFPDRASKERFFSNPEYLKVRDRRFEKAVSGTTIIAEYGE